MADKRNRDDNEAPTGVNEDRVRGVADEDDEFEETDDLDDQEDEEEGSTF